MLSSADCATGATNMRSQRAAPRVLIVHLICSYPQTGSRCDSGMSVLRIAVGRSNRKQSLRGGYSGESRAAHFTFGVLGKLRARRALDGQAQRLSAELPFLSVALGKVEA